MIRARIQLIVCMVCFGTISLFVKGIDLSPTEIGLYRPAIA